MKSERMKNIAENMKENNLYGCLVMMKNRRDFGGTYVFSSFAIKKKPLQIGVIYRKRKKWQKRGVDDKLLNVPFPSLCLCCVLGSVHFPFFFNVFSFVSQKVTCFF